MSLRNHGQQFLDLVDHVESFSRGDQKTSSSEDPALTYSSANASTHDGDEPL